MTATSILMYFVYLIISPFAGVAISYQVSKKHTNSNEIVAVMCAGAIVSMGLVGIGFPAYWLITS